jgi:hypothetical protein
MSIHYNTDLIYTAIMRGFYMWRGEYTTMYSVDRFLRTVSMPCNSTHITGNLNQPNSLGTCLSRRISAGMPLRFHYEYP